MLVVLTKRPAAGTIQSLTESEIREVPVNAQADGFANVRSRAITRFDQSYPKSQPAQH
jgi:hypothetical protein